MTDYSGKITKTNERDWGSKTIYSWQIAGAPMWFRCESDPKLEIGGCYSFHGESPNKITEITEIPEATLKAAVQQVPPHPKTDEVPPTSSPDYWRWKQMQDLKRQDYFDWRDARADATRIVCCALDNDVLSLGQKKGIKLDLLIGQIKETTATLLEKDA